MEPKDDILTDFYPPQPDSTELEVVCLPANYSASTIARAVEDCDTHLLNLNVTSRRHGADGELIVVALRVGARSADAVARSLARYGYETLTVDPNAESVLDERARTRAREVLHILNI